MNTNLSKLFDFVEIKFKNSNLYKIGFEVKFKSFLTGGDSWV